VDGPRHPSRPTLGVARNPYEGRGCHGVKGGASRGLRAHGESVTEDSEEGDSRNVGVGNLLPDKRADGGKMPDVVRRMHGMYKSVIVVGGHGLC